MLIPNNAVSAIVMNGNNKYIWHNITQNTDISLTLENGQDFIKSPHGTIQNKQNGLLIMCFMDIKKGI